MNSLNTKVWLDAARLRTLPLSVSGIITGTAYGYEYTQVNDLPFKVTIPLLALLTTLGFQILSNFANDYGDGVKGTDNADRIGPARALQSGAITPAQMKNGVIITAIISFVSALMLIYSSLGFTAIKASLVFLALGILAIWAAIKYTVGKDAYGYRGLGDVFVFVFFGPVSVLGIFYLITFHVSWPLVLPSLTIGLLSVAVLNLNNMRDVDSDAKSGKNTIVVKLGIHGAKQLHMLFLGIAFIAAISIAFLSVETSLGNIFLTFVPLLAFVPLIAHARMVYKNTNPRALDPELKKVALVTFFYALLNLLTAVV